MSNRPEDIKAELQGDGYLRDLRERVNESVQETSEKAIEKFEENNREITAEYLQNNFSEVIIGLVGYETDIFESRSNEVYPQALVKFLEEEYNSGQASVSSYTTSGEPELTEYSAIRETFRDIEQEFNAHDDFTEVFKRAIPELYNLIKPIVQSEGQSSFKRAGGAFRQQFINLVEVSGYNLRSQSSEGSGYILTFSPENENEAKEIYFGFHTTLKDRFRATLPGPDNMPNYLVTASGADAISDNDSEDITTDRLNQIADADAKLIAIDKEADQYPNRDEIISYEVFITEELPSYFD
ncbi:PDDEXK family nuclease [Haloarcula hispanica]|uniref:hypothetical protein n=1 Tax=Haloarcula hispanica TaxID=51589 RepID=UPI0011B7E691|nr:hypothetical protein [Haloarcula hispanica]